MPNKFREPEAWAKWVYQRIDTILHDGGRDGNARILELGYWIRELEDQGFYPSEDILDRVDRVVDAIRQVQTWNRSNRKKQDERKEIVNRSIAVHDFVGDFPDE